MKDLFGKTVQAQPKPKKKPTLDPRSYKMGTDREIAWSFGGGTQTAAIAVLIKQGKLPKPDITVMADTFREATETWEWNDRYLRPMLAKIGIEIEIASHNLSTVDMFRRPLGVEIGTNPAGDALPSEWMHAGEGKDDGKLMRSGNVMDEDLLMPVWFLNDKDEPQKLPTLCSNEWKKRVFYRYLRSKGYGPKNPVYTWMGMSMDEIDRCKDDDVYWHINNWPLVFGVPTRRSGCIDLVVKEFGVEPPKSSCFYCPHRRNPQWKRLHDSYPFDWNVSVGLDYAIRNHPSGKFANCFLHEQCVPLDMADLEKESTNQVDCQTGFCFV